MKYTQFWVLCLFSFFTHCILAQDIELSVECSKDTILQGSTFKLTYKTKGGAITDFIEPNLEAFIILGGPNISSSISIVNGVVDQTASYSYILQANEVGDHIISKAIIEVDEKPYDTNPVKINVLENSDYNIQGEEIPQNSFPKKSNPKRKTYKL